MTLSVYYKFEMKSIQLEIKENKEDEKQNERKRLTSSRDYSGVIACLVSCILIGMFIGVLLHGILTTPQNLQTNCSNPGCSYCQSASPVNYCSKCYTGYILLPNQEGCQLNSTHP